MSEIKLNPSGGHLSLCNHIMRSIALNFLSKKYNLRTKYAYHDIICNKLGIILHNGDYIYPNTILVNDKNYLDILHNKDFIKANLDLNKGYFQSEEITNIIIKHLHSKEQKNNIISKNPFKNRYNNNNDLFVHIRLDDAKRYNVGINYYLNAISSIKHTNLFIASDSLNDTFIKQIKSKYGNAILVNKNPAETIQFGSTCKNIVLSHGSFSAIIGYLSFFSNIYYPDTMPIVWCPLGMFTGKNWNALPLNS